MKIFISYGRDEHLELARRLKDDLKARGHSVWFDEDCLQPGFDWESHIERGLEWCASDSNNGRIVFLMTPHAIRRPDGYCLNELARAIYRGLVVVPVMVVWCEPPLSICRIQWLDMRDCVPVEGNREKYELKRDRLIQALEQGDLDFEAIQSTLFHHLQPLDFSADIAQHLQNFVGRKWIFDRIDAWLTVPNASRIFWITGSPGIGKTAIASYLCHKRREVVAFHLCRYGHDDKSDPKRCVLSLAYQLGSQFPEYQEYIARLLGDLNKSAATLFDNLIVQALARQPHLQDYPLLLVIDGLDEATHQGRNELAEFIAREFPRTPAWLRLLITSRPEQEVLQPLQALSPYRLDANSPENRNDIRSYIRESLTLSLPEHELKDQTIDIILEKSEGIFLYAKAVVGELREGRLALDRLDEFPQGLGGIFFSFFARQFPDVSSYRQQHRPLLEMIVAARGPLPADLAKTALNWTPYDYQVSEKGDAGGTTFSSLGSLFPYTGGSIRPFHQCIVDWLTNPAKAGIYFVDIKEGHRRLAETCWAEYKSGSHQMSAYTSDHLPTHLMECNRWEDLLELVKDPAAGLITKWIEGGEGQKGLTCLIRLINYLEKHGRDYTTSAGLATQVSRIYSLWGKYDDAEHWLRKAIGKTSWIRRRRVRAVALHELGSLSLYRNDLIGAGRNYRKALHSSLRGLPRYHDEAAANLVGLCIVALGRYLFSKAIPLAARAKKEAKKAGDVRHFIAGERLIGNAYKALGRYAEAKIHLENAIHLSDEHAIYIEKARSLLLKGWLQYDQATLNQTLENKTELILNEAIEIAQESQNLFCTLDAQLSLGWCTLGANATIEAEKWFLSLKSALLPGVHPELQAGCELGLAEVAHQKGDLQSAGKLYGGIIPFCRQNDIRVWLCKALVGLGAISWHTERWNEGMEYWDQALRTALTVSPFRRTLTQISIERCKANSVATPR